MKVGRLIFFVILICLPAVLVVGTGVFLIATNVPRAIRTQPSRIGREYREIAEGLIARPERASYNGQEYWRLQADRVMLVSSRVRGMLMKRAPEFVSAAENFAKEVVYIPVSATGVSPQIDPVTHRRGFRSKDVKPVWIATPMLYALSRLTQGLVPARSGESQ